MKGDEGDKDDDEVPNDEAINDLIMRTDEEFEIFQVRIFTMKRYFSYIITND